MVGFDDISEAMSKYYSICEIRHLDPAFATGIQGNILHGSTLVWARKDIAEFEPI
jgi:hypothetical protein